MRYRIGNKMGYITVNEEYIHRKVMEHHLNRKLNSVEIVHHRDGDIKNNDIENLFLFPNASMHMKYHWYVNKNGWISEEEFMNKMQ